MKGAASDLTVPADEPIVSAPLPHAAPSKFYVPQLDALRFFAFLCIFWFHCSQPSIWEHLLTPRWLAFAALISRASRSGLGLFFFLSSYLITTLLALEERKTGTVNLQSFYVRRILRIWPLYFLYLGGIALLGLRLHTWHISAARFAAMSLLAANWYAIAAGLGNTAILPLWSISVEEQFYAIWPSAFRRFGARWFVGVCTALVLVSLGTTHLLVRHGAAAMTIDLNSFSIAVWFAAGSLFALLVRPPTTPSWLQSCSLSLTGSLCWLCHARMGPSSPTIGNFIDVIGCALFLLAALKLPAAIPGWLTYLGKISYGLYVWHGFVLHVYPYFAGARTFGGGSILLKLLATMILAAISYKLIELPFLRMKARFEVVRTRSV